MIELNLTYEESKKILELGYDFSYICRDFELHEEGKITKFVLVERHDCGLVALWDCDDHEARGYSPKSWWITPIIPKAALEACLPDYLLKKGCHLFYHVRKFMGELYWANCRDESLTEEWFSNFEAFLWLHENYPEELKKKFGEVMG
jgi:hypothetical protein